MPLVGNIERPPLSDAEHDAWRALIQSRSGLGFGESRVAALRRALWRRMRQRAMTRYGDYYRVIVAEPEDGSEWCALLDLLVNHETSFFRHGPSFRALREQVLPQLLTRKDGEYQRRLQLWSAGCSRGPEAYSLAISALEVLRSDLKTWQVMVTGSDISLAILRQARAGRYPTSTTDDDIAPALRERYFKVTEVDAKPALEVNDSLRAVVGFGFWNAVRPDTYPTSRQDVIFCHNLLLYQRPEVRRATFEALCDRLNPGGHLFLGPGEVVGPSVPGVHRARLEGCSAYVKPA